MHISQDILNKIHKMNLPEFLETKYGLTFTSLGTNEGLGCRCPHPDHNDSTPSFRLWKGKDGNWAWCCQGCHVGKKGESEAQNKKNYGNDAIAFVMWMSDHKKTNHIYTFYEAACIVMNYLNISAIPISKEDRERFSILKTNKEKASFCHSLLINQETEEAKVAYKYLTKRGLDKEDLIQWEIGFNNLDRIVFPFKNRLGEVVGSTMRIVGTNTTQPKYIHSSNNIVFNKSSYLYGIDKVSSSLGYLIVTEGQMDVIMAYKYGIKNVVATSGTHFMENHALYLKKHLPNIEKIIFIYDGDGAGKQGLNQSAEIARDNGFMVEYFIPPDFQDLCDLVKEHKENAREYILSCTIPYFYQELQEEIETYEKLIVSFYSRLIPKANNILAKTKNKNESALIRSYIKSKFNIQLKEGENYIETG